MRYTYPLMGGSTALAIAGTSDTKEDWFASSEKGARYG